MTPLYTPTRFYQNTCASAAKNNLLGRGNKMKVGVDVEGYAGIIPLQILQFSLINSCSLLCTAA